MSGPASAKGTRRAGGKADARSKGYAGRTLRKPTAPPARVEKPLKAYDRNAARRAAEMDDTEER